MAAAGGRRQGGLCPCRFARRPRYALLCGATRLSVVPTADLWVTGLYGEAPYLRGLLDKLGVKPDFLTCGDYKSAAEMFMRTGPSPEAEEMQNWLLDGIFDTYVGSRSPRAAASRPPRSKTGSTTARTRPRRPRRPA